MVVNQSSCKFVVCRLPIQYLDIFIYLLNSIRYFPTFGACRRALEAESPADGDDDGDVAEGHHEDRQQPGQREEVEEVGQLQLLVGEGDRVETLSE